MTLHDLDEITLAVRELEKFIKAKNRFIKKCAKYTSTTNDGYLNSAVTTATFEICKAIFEADRVQYTQICKQVGLVDEDGKPFFSRDEFL